MMIWSRMIVVLFMVWYNYLSYCLFLVINFGELFMNKIYFTYTGFKNLNREWSNVLYEISKAIVYVKFTLKK